MSQPAPEPGTIHRRRRDRCATPSVLSRVLLVAYLVTLLWLTLFKLSYEIPLILAEHQVRSLNLVPFLGVGHMGRSETLSNLVAFVPFGLLLSVNVKNKRPWALLTLVLGFSVVVEALQFILAIGITDVTDIIMNTLGGLIGLVLYRLVNQLVRTDVLDRVVVVLGTILCVAFILLRLLVFRVRY